MVLDAESRTLSAVMTNARKLERITNKMWAVAHKAPMYARRVPAKADGSRGESVRTQRLISKHAIKIMLAGAAMQCVARHRSLLIKYGLKPEKEARSQPFLPKLTPGARMRLEQFLCAYTQEGVLRAKALRDAEGVHKRMPAELVKEGFDMASLSVFAGAMPAPMRTVVVATPPRRAHSARAKRTPEKKPRADDTSAVVQDTGDESAPTA